jgi:hypothetical protein
MNILKDNFEVSHQVKMSTHYNSHIMHQKGLVLGYLDANTRAGRSTEVGRGTAKSVLKVRKSWSITTLQE